MRKEKIIKIIKETRKIAEKQYNVNTEEQDFQQVIIKQAKMNLEQLRKNQEIIDFYRNILEVIYNYLTD